ncbi:hypothetical protein BGX29_006693 [Mortierella sp. GBA35]|nr:hypothetical protein BGX29_006693 [Mortierella sp. GBA35]
MPKPSNTHPTGSSHASAMLNQNNLAQHTQHHQELDESRDFVREFLDTLDPSSAPQTDPGLEPVELVPDIMLKSSSAGSKHRSHEPQQYTNIRPAQQQPPQTQQHKQYKLQQSPQIQAQPQPHTNPDKSKRKKVSKEHQDTPKRTTTTEPQPILQDDKKLSASGVRRKEGNGEAGKGNSRQGKKRKQEASEVEQGVQDLEIRDPHSGNPSSREKRKRQTEGTTTTKPKGPITTRGKQGSRYSVFMHRRVRLDSGPSPTVVPGKMDHLGIFKKGKASKKTTVQRDTGKEFSEDAFLNQRADPGGSPISGRCREQVVTSTYFADPKQDELAESKSSYSDDDKSHYVQSNSVDTATSIHSPSPKQSTKKRVDSSPHHKGRDRRDRRDIPSYHPSARSSQEQQVNRSNTHEFALRIQSPIRINAVELEQQQQQVSQPVPVEYIPVAGTYADYYIAPQPYEYAAPPPAQWQLEPYHNMPDPHQWAYPVYDNPVPPVCQPVPDHGLLPIEYNAHNVHDDTEYDHGLPLDIQPPPPPLPSNNHFHWRPHRLF